MNEITIEELEEFELTTDDEQKIIQKFLNLLKAVRLDRAAALEETELFMYGHSHDYSHMVAEDQNVGYVELRYD